MRTFTSSKPPGFNTRCTSYVTGGGGEGDQDVTARKRTHLQEILPLEERSQFRLT